MTHPPQGTNYAYVPHSWYPLILFVLLTKGNEVANGLSKDTLITLVNEVLARWQLNVLFSIEMDKSRVLHSEFSTNFEFSVAEKAMEIS